MRAIYLLTCVALLGCAGVAKQLDTGFQAATNPPVDEATSEVAALQDQLRDEILSANARIAGLTEELNEAVNRPIPAAPVARVFDEVPSPPETPSGPSAYELSLKSKVVQLQGDVESAWREVDAMRGVAIAKQEALEDAQTKITDLQQVLASLRALITQIQGETDYGGLGIAGIIGAIIGFALKFFAGRLPKR